MAAAASAFLRCRRSLRRFFHWATAAIASIGLLGVFRCRRGSEKKWAMLSRCG